MAQTANVTASGSQNIDALFSGIRWDAVTLSYSFPESPSYYEPNYIGGEPHKSFSPLAPFQVSAARKIFAMFASVANIDFTEVQENAFNHADLRLAGADIAAPAWAYYPSASPDGGDAWFRSETSWFSDVRMGSYGFYVFIHEIGHVLGLKHGHETSKFGALPAARNSMEFSIMTYYSYVGASGVFLENEQWGYAQSLMMDDIAALQHMYGADYTTNAGNTVYQWNVASGESIINGVRQGLPGGNRIFMTVWDGGGNDTYDFTNYKTNLTVDLRPGSWTKLSSTQIAELGYEQPARGNVANALLYQSDLRSLIENAKGGSGHDIIIGNITGNTLWGNAGNDLLNGLQGADTMYGGAGNDSYHLDNPKDRVIETAAGGTADRVVSPFSYALGSYLENLTGTGTASIMLTGNALNNAITGNSAANRIRGMGGNDKLNGGLGNDTLIGGAGKDAFIFNTRPSVSNLDLILGFSVADDVIYLDNAVFPKLGKTGQLAATAFWMGSKAQDSSDRIVYNPGLGALSYDPDGTGKAAQVMIAWLPKGLKMTPGDLWVI
ncbi:M10 family metallopeptidase [Microvirga solisilvae]|uniref:M10 family metallopeptidase n=1 Tax=Microvirga solisilvae TaxID=2919498 RepID=UPI001FAF4CC2|nr:M10 family metallopeptidase [Microvirga solisilvae]